jgi:glycerol-3-phosphate dehydrogenase
MKRDFEALGRGPFDLLVVGGGIYGAWTAYDAALRGLSVALVEQRDWGSATSSASSKLIHGGLRYLEHGELGLVRKTLVERRRLARLGPHRVRPLRFLMPVYGGDRVGRFRLKLGLTFYDRLAGGDQPVPGHRYLSPEALLGELPITDAELRGGFSFGDCLIDDARLVLEIVDGAVQAGAVAVNRATARALLAEGGRAAGAVVEDGETGATVEVRAASTVASAGPWVSRLAATAPAAEPVASRLTKGVHLVLPALPRETALVISSNDDKRIVFLIPWYGRTLLGTTDTDYAGEPGEVRVEREDADYLLERMSRVLTGVGWSERDVIASFAGVRTLPATADAHPSSVSREWRLTRPLPGLFVPVGGKLTSARSDAASIVDRLPGAAPASAGTLDRPFPWAPAAPFDGWLDRVTGEGVAAGLDEETARCCALRHGTKVEELLEAIRSDPSLAGRIDEELPFCRAEIVHAARHEMARGPEDILRRRIPLTLLSRLPRETLDDVVRLAGSVA